jgi:hypothetical protein
MSFLLIDAIDLLAFSLFFYLAVAFRDQRRRRGLPYPPGPPSLPIVGNILDAPKEAPWSAYAEMSQKYGSRSILAITPSPKLMTAFEGDVFCLRILDQCVVVLSSLSAIKDLLEKRGEVYAERPPWPVLEMCVPRYYPLLIICHFDGASITERTWTGLCLMPGRVKFGVKDESFWIAPFDQARRRHIGK